MEYPLDKSCVTIEPLDPQPCDGCGDSVEEETGALAGRWATRQVMLDLRNNGTTICIGIYCDECAEEVASRLRDSLPDERPEGESTITPNHPVLTDRGFIRADELKKGDRIITADNDAAFMDSLAKAAESQSEDLRSTPGERVIMRTNTVPGSLIERVLDERTEDLCRWAEGKDFHASPFPSFAPPPEAEPGDATGPGRNPVERGVFAILDQIIAIVPLHESFLRAELKRLRKSAQYKSPEAMGDIWYRGSQILSETFPEPDALSDWQRMVVDIWMNREAKL